MSQSSVAYAHYDDTGRQAHDRHRHAQEASQAHERHDHHRAAASPRRSSRAEPAPRARDYTFGHGGKQVRIGPVAFWIVVGSLVIMASWSIATGSYFAFHDDVLTRLIARQAEMQFAYEDRIAELRAQVDRITSRQLIDQEQFDKKLEAVLRRQATLESRAASMSGIAHADPMPTGSIQLRPATKTVPGEGWKAPKPKPINDTVIFVAPPDREARLESRVPVTTVAAPRTPAKAGLGGPDSVLARLSESLDRVESRQSAALNAMEESYDAKVRRMRGVLADLGLDSGKNQIAAAGTGGPFIPVKLAAGAGAFERQLYRISLARAQAERLTRTLVAVPVRKPIVGEIDTSSGFGIRYDPFFRSPAMHTGLDIRAATGNPVKATAAGTVTTAGWNGGYGKMVEIDHGNGLTTRYGHMSAIEVSVGQHVRIGQTVGKVGSTGRSTGPHLHYETRVDGEAVDPQKFLRAGIRLGSPG